MMLPMDDQRRSKRSRQDPQEHVSISFCGERLNYTYLAAKSAFSNVMDSKYFTLTSKGSIKEVFESTDSQSSVYGVLALESSSHGTIHNVYDKLLVYDGKIVIVGEIAMLEQHYLCTKQTITDELSITSVIGHPHILECCSDYLDCMDSIRKSKGYQPLKRIGSWDSSAACAYVASIDTSNMTKSSVNSSSDEITEEVIAAIGSKEAATYHHLYIIKEGIGNDQNAETRYIIIAKTANPLVDQLSPLSSLSLPLSILDPLHLASRSVSSASTSKKASIALALRNIPGSIFKMSSCFALRDIDIIKIESRPAATFPLIENTPCRPHSPTRGTAIGRAYTQKHWDLIFYVDYEPSANDDVNIALLSNLREYSLWVKELGHYCSGLQKIEVKPKNWSEVLDIMSIS